MGGQIQPMGMGPMAQNPMMQRQGMQPQMGPMGPQQGGMPGGAPGAMPGQGGAQQTPPGMPFMIPEGLGSLGAPLPGAGPFQNLLARVEMGMKMYQLEEQFGQQHMKLGEKGIKAIASLAGGGGGGAA